MGVASEAKTREGGGRTLGAKLQRTRRLGTTLLVVMAGGICSAAASRFAPEPWADALLAASLGALSLCLTALLLLRLRLGRALAPDRADELQALAARSLRLLPILWDGLAPVLEAIGRILDAAAALATSFPWLGGKLQGLRAGEAKAVVDSLLALGPEARDALAALAVGIEETDLEVLREALQRLDAAVEGVRGPLESFTPGGRSR